MCSTVHAQKTELVSVLDLDKVLSDYYKNLNVWCSDTASKQEKAYAGVVLYEILSSPISTNLYPEMIPEREMQNTQNAVEGYLQHAKDSILRFEYRIRHFNAKNVLLDSIAIGQSICHTAQLFVEVTCYNMRKSRQYNWEWYKRWKDELKDEKDELDKLEHDFKVIMSDLERFTFVKKSDGVWGIAKTELMDPIIFRMGANYDGIEEAWLLNPQKQFDKFKYLYVENMVYDTNRTYAWEFTKYYSVAIVRDSLDKVGLVSLNGLELLPPVFDSISFKDWCFYAYRNGARYDVHDGSFGLASGISCVICREDEVKSHFHKVVDCYVSDSPISWGMWVTVMGGEIPQGCSHNTPVTGMNKHDVKKFLKRIKSHHVRGIRVRGHISFNYFVLTPDQSRSIHRNEHYLWLAEPFNNFDITLNFSVYNKHTRVVNLQKQGSCGYVRLITRHPTYWDTYEVFPQ